jgi:probable LLM family oxidoreductase
MEIGIDSFAIAFPAGKTGTPAAASEHLHHLIEQIELADQVGLDIYGVGEHHRQEFLDSAPTIIMGVAVARTQRIRLTSAVTVLSAADPVRVFQEFATLDLLSKGRMEIVAGRGSLIEAFPLFGFRLEDYDALFDEKLELLLKIRENPQVHWSGKFRPALTGQGIYPRPFQPVLPIWVGAGGSPESFIRAGVHGLPLMVAIIGGETERFRPLIDLYYKAGKEAGHPRNRLKVGLHVIGYVAETTKEAVDHFYPGWLETFSGFGKERGWRPPTREQFEATRAKDGAYFVGNPDEVVEKLRAQSKALGGIARVTFQMGVGNMTHERMMSATELLGTKVKPAVSS